MQSALRAGFALVVLASVSGCSNSSSPPPSAAALPAPYIGMASGAFGEGISTGDKASANKAEVAALASGERKAWRGDDGAYGYVAPSAASGDCREFSHTVFINGRPKVGKGNACKSGEGGWTLKG